eukprot:TRINITY_DN1406_c0_g1_i5.p6 TRINITY_DN1406_c0_g1~~TRINITY_DN1406_c0_g1_i5.p6  ORF type:complete len:156 (+),score=8.42 TRINITY_DN1406_c0_g1_i5:2570-3037(+)
MVEDLEVVVDGLGCDFLAEPLLQNLVGHVQTYYDGPSDIIPHLLNGWVVDEVQIVALYYILSSGELVGYELPLSEGNAASVDIRVVAGHAALALDLLGVLHELSLTSVLLRAQSLVLYFLACKVEILSELLVESLYEQLLGVLNCHLNHPTFTLA